MNAPDFIEKQTLDILIDNYAYICKRLKKKDILHDEQALQSATASVFIEYNKSKGSVSVYTNKLKQKLAITEDADTELVKTWMHFINSDIKDIITLDDSESTRVKAYIKAQIVSGKGYTGIRFATIDYIRRLTDHRLNEQQRNALVCLLNPEGFTQLEAHPDLMSESDNDDAPGLTEAE